MSRFFRRGLSKIKWAPSVAGSSPTRPEITAGIDLSPQIAAVAGFQLSNNPIETPDLSTAFNSQIDGPDSTADSSLTFYDDNASSTIRSALAKGTIGNVLLFPYGDVTGKRCEVWNVKSTGVNDAWSLDATAGQFEVGFAVLLVPNQAGTTP